jgi:hypothetical protein
MGFAKVTKQSQKEESNEQQEHQTMRPTSSPAAMMLTGSS